MRLPRCKLLHGPDMVTMGLTERRTLRFPPPPVRYASSYCRPSKPRLTAAQASPRLSTSSYCATLAEASAKSGAPTPSLPQPPPRNPH